MLSLSLPPFTCLVYRDRGGKEREKGRGRRKLNALSREEGGREKHVLFPLLPFLPRQILLPRYSRGEGRRSKKRKKKQQFLDLPFYVTCQDYPFQGHLGIVFSICWYIFSPPQFWVNFKPKSVRPPTLLVRLSPLSFPVSVLPFCPCCPHGTVL